MIAAVIQQAEKAITNKRIGDILMSEKSTFSYPPWLPEGKNEEKNEAAWRHLTCLALSWAAYAETEEAMVRRLDHLKELKHGLTEVVLSGSGCSERYALGLKKKTKELYVAFRGTVNFQDVLIDLCLFGIPNDMRGRFHDGFYRQASKIPVGPFSTFLEDNPEYSIVFTGHSKGGSVATIIALLFLQDSRIQIKRVQNKPRVNCVTFGASFCCDQVAADSNKEYEDFFCHYVNQDDMVPRLLSFGNGSYQSLQKRGSAQCSEAD
eukprot:g63208.t1